MHSHITKSVITKQPDKTNYAHNTIASYTDTNTFTRRSKRLASRTQTPQRQMHDRTTRHKGPTPGSNLTIGSQNTTETSKLNERQSKKQKHNIFERGTDLLHIITLNVRGLQTREKMKQLEYATDLQ
jgi:hypothetical protein